MALSLWDAYRTLGAVWDAHRWMHHWMLHWGDLDGLAIALPVRIDQNEAKMT